MNPPPPFAFEETYRRYLDGLLTNNRPGRSAAPPSREPQLTP
jgi:hypothetical protein